MVLYHGTVKTFLGSILKEGLKPVKENRWQANWYGPANHDVIANDEEEVVYLTPLKEAAQEFARNKARYLRDLAREEVQVWTESSLESFPTLLLSTPSLWSSR